MKHSILLLTCLIGLLFIAGCSSKKTDSKDGSGTELSEADLNAQREGRFGAGNLPTAEGEGAFRDVNFDFDSASISDLGQQNIEYNTQILEGHNNVKIQLEGHCDERGTAEYNMALGQRRAQAVKDVLMSMGINSSRISVISYGEEVPLDPARDDIAWAKNRRVHFSAFTE